MVGKIDGDPRKSILAVCAKLFLEKGYHQTKVSEICREAGISNGSFYHAFPSKDDILYEYVTFMFENQFDLARSIVGAKADPLYIYATDTAVQLALTEMDKNLRDMYNEAYNSPKISAFVYERTTKELYGLFKGYLPDYSEGDFYELEIGSGGIMRNYMTVPTNMYFTLEKKIRRFLDLSLTIYHVPEAERQAVIEYVLQMDLEKMAQKVVNKLFKRLSGEYPYPE